VDRGVIRCEGQDKTKTMHDARHANHESEGSEFCRQVLY
jgi:hypothetical protein